MKSYLKYVKLVLGIFSLFLLLFLSVVGVCFILMKKRPNIFPELHYHRYLRINPEKKESSNGLVEITRDLSEDEYISYETSNGDHILISNFDSKEYICHGTCFCEEKEESVRRVSSATSPLFQKAVIYLVAAVTSSIAFKRGEEYFKDYCKKEFSDSCPSNTYVSSKIDIDDCRYTEEEWERIKAGSTYDPRAFDNIDDELLYECTGKCILAIPPPEPDMTLEMQNQLRNTIQGMEGMEKERFRCDSLEMTKGLSILGKEGRTRGYVRMVQDNYGGDIWNGLKKFAEQEFMHDHLDKFCVKQSLLGQVPHAGQPGGYVEFGFCGGCVMTDSFLLFENPHVKCVLEK